MMILEVGLIVALAVMGGAEPNDERARKLEAAQRAIREDRPVEAEAILKAAVDEENDPLRRAEALERLSGFYADKRRKHYDQAERMLSEAREIRESRQGPDSPDLAKVLFELGSLDMVVHGKEAEGAAKGLLHRALAIWEKAPRPEDRVHAAKALHSLAFLSTVKEKPAEAEEMLDRALKIREKALRPDDPLLADILDDLGDLHAAQFSPLRPEEPGGHGELADRFYRRALKIREKALGPDHPEVAATCYNIAQIAFLRDRFADGEREGLRYLEIQNKIESKDTEKAIKVWMMVAAAARDRKDYGEAGRRLEKAQTLVDHSRASMGRECVAMRSVRAVFAVDTGKYDDAERLLREALEILATILGRDNPGVVAARELMRDGYKAHVEDAEAPRLWHRAQTFRGSAEGDDAADLGDILSSYAELLRRSNRVVPKPTPEDLKALIKAGVVLSESETLDSLAGYTDLYDKSITDAELPHIARLVDLETLDLGRRQVTNAGVAHLRGLINLKKLDLHKSGVSSEGLTFLEKLSALENLDLGFSKVKDDGLVHLKGSKNLRVLDLAFTNVTDAGLKHLEGLPKLEQVDLTQTLVTDQGIARLRKMRPGLVVEFEPRKNELFDFMTGDDDGAVPPPRPPFGDEVPGRPGAGPEIPRPPCPPLSGPPDPAPPGSL